MKTCLVISILVISILVIAFLFLLWNNFDSYTLLEPKSPTGVQLASKTTGDMRSSTSTVYIKYPDTNKLVKTDVVFSEDEGPALAKQTDRLSIVWIDDHHVSITFKGRTYSKPDTKIIEY